MAPQAELPLSVRWLTTRLLDGKTFEQIAAEEVLAPKVPTMSRRSMSVDPAIGSRPPQPCRSANSPLDFRTVRTLVLSWSRRAGLHTLLVGHDEKGRRAHANVPRRRQDRVDNRGLDLG